MLRAEPPRTRASMRMAGDEVTRGTTSAVNTLHAVASTRAMPAIERDQAGDRLHERHPVRCPGASRPAVVSPRRASRRPDRVPPARPAPPPGASAASSPRPFACVSRRRFEATPQPRMPCTTKFTARRFGNGYRLTAYGSTSGRRSRKVVDGERALQPRRDLVVVRPEPDVGIPALVTRTRADECPQRDVDHVVCRVRRVRRISLIRRFGLLSISFVLGSIPSDARRATAVRRGRRRRDRLAVTFDARRHRVGADRRRPVAGHSLRPRRRRGEEGAGIAREAGLDDGAGEGPADRLLVVAAHGEPQVRHAAAGQVAREVLRRLGEAGAPARDAGPHRLGGEARLLGHLRAGQGERHGVAPAGVEVGRHLQRGGRRLASHRSDPHPVGTLLRQRNGVEPGDGVGAEVARAPDLVEQLRRHRPDA